MAYKGCKLSKEGRVTLCKGLSAVMQEPYSRGTRQQGVSMHTLINLRTNKFSRHMIVLKSGEHGKKGIVMNNCPFCAKPIFKAD